MPGAENDTLETFKQFDLNGDGSISHDELRKVLKELDPVRMDDESIDTIFATVDKNKDGKIDVAEFVNWMTGKQEPSEMSKSERKVADKAAKKTAKLAAKKAKDAKKPKKKCKKGQGSDEDEEESSAEEDSDEDEEDSDDDDDHEDSDEEKSLRYISSTARNLIFSKMGAAHEGSSQAAVSVLHKLSLPKGAEAGDAKHVELYLRNFAVSFRTEPPDGADRAKCIRWLKAALTEIAGGKKEYGAVTKWILGNCTMWQCAVDQEFHDLQQFAVDKLDEIGGKYETEVFLARGLGDSLGGLGGELKPYRPRQDVDGITPPVLDEFDIAALGDDVDMTEIHTPDMAYVGLLMAAVHAMDPVFQESATKVCTKANGKATSPSPKGLMRMMAKLKTDHLEADMPRTAENVDTNRIAWTFEKESEFCEAFEGARKLGTLLRVKNSYSHDFDALEISKGYRNILANYRFEPPGLTWGALAREEKTQKAWKKLREDTVETFHRLGYADTEAMDDDEYDADGKNLSIALKGLDAAFEILTSGPLKDKQACLVCEIQYMLAPYMKMRKFTHAWYKIVRAEDAHAMVTDYAC